jgi:Hg(II)-responsive transcriptional regulator
VPIRLDLIPGYRVHAGGVRTSEVAAQARVNTQTLRYYERRGLLPEPERSRSGYRAYTPDAVRVVRFVKRAQQLGFTLGDIEELLHLAEGGPDSCEEARMMARTRIADLQQRIEELASMRDALARLVDTCDQPRAERDCPILRDIETAATTATGSTEQ